LYSKEKHNSLLTARKEVEENVNINKINTWLSFVIVIQDAIKI